MRLMFILAQCGLLLFLLSIDASSVQAGGEAGGEAGYGFESSTRVSDASIRSLIVTDLNGTIYYSDGGGTLFVANESSGPRDPGIGHPVSQHPLKALAFHPDSRVIFWGDEAGQVGTLHIDTYEVTSTDLGPHGMTAMALDDDAATLAVGDEGGQVRLLDASDLTDGAGLAVVRTLPAGSSMIGALAFSGDQGLLAVGDTGGRVRLFDIHDWSSRGTLDTQRGWVTSLAFWSFAGQEHLIVGVSVGELLVYTLPNLEEPRTLELTAWANALLELPGPGLLAVGRQDGIIGLYHPVGSTFLNLTGELQARRPVHSLAVHPDGLGFVSGGSAGELAFWGLDSDGDRVTDRQDPFPHEATQWLDFDGDGWGDNPNGAYPDAFPLDPSASQDSDSDSFPDHWNPGRSRVDSTTGMSLDAFPRNPNEWRDSDGDSVGDNDDPMPELAYVKHDWQVVTITVTALVLSVMFMVSAFVYVGSRGACKRLTREMDDEMDPALALALPGHREILERSRRCLRQGRGFAARRMLNRLNHDHLKQSRLQRQVKADIRAFKLDLEAWAANGFETSEGVLKPTREALAQGWFQEAAELITTLRREQNQLLRHQQIQQRREDREAELGTSLVSQLERPSVTFDWQKRAPVRDLDQDNVARPDKPEAPGKVVNISISDCIINRSELGLAEGEGEELVPRISASIVRAEGARADGAKVDRA